MDGRAVVMPAVECRRCRQTDGGDDRKLILMVAVVMTAVQ